MIIIITLLILTVFILFTEILTVNIIFSEEKTIEFHLTVFALSLKFGKRKGPERRSGGVKPGFAAFGRFLFSLIRASEIKINEISLPSPEAEPGNEAIAKGVLLSALSAAAGIIKDNSRFFSLRSIKFDSGEHNNLKLEASLRLPLFKFIVCLLPLLADHARAFIKNAKGRSKKWQKTK